MCGACSAQDPDQGAPCLRPEGSAALLSALCSPFPPTCVSPQWIIAELACYTYSMVVIPLYDTLGPGAIRYIIDTGEPSCPLLPLAASPTSASHPSSQLRPKQPTQTNTQRPPMPPCHLGGHSPGLLTPGVSGSTPRLDAPCLLEPSCPNHSLF